MKKKGLIWVSAVLYIALGMIVISLLMAAGLPLINKMRDRNTIAQTKAVMFNLDSNIKAVANEAKGSARYLSPVDISAGQLFIDQGDSNRIEWRMKTQNRMIEPNTEFSEGDMKMKLLETATVDEYEMTLYFDYASSYVNLTLGGEYQNPLQGRFSMSIRNEGQQSCPLVECPLEVSVLVT